MVERELQSKLSSIFGLEKVSFDEPGDASEQECIFVDIDRANAKVVDGFFRGRMTGQISIFGNAQKMPLGYFIKRIADADARDTRDLVFFGLEQNTKIFQNIIQRSFSFTYFFNVPFDPNLGTINQFLISEVSYT